MLDKANSAEATDVGEWKQSCATPAPLSSFLFPSPTSILHLSSLISLTFSLIKPPPSLLHSILLFPLSPSLQRGKNKQLPGSGWPMNSKWLWRAEALTDFLRGKRPATRLEKKKQRQINMVQSKCAHTHWHTELRPESIWHPDLVRQQAIQIFLKVEVHKFARLEQVAKPHSRLMLCFFNKKEQVRLFLPLKIILFESPFKLSAGLRSLPHLLPLRKLLLLPGLHESIVHFLDYQPHRMRAMRLHSVFCFELTGRHHLEQTIISGRLFSGAQQRLNKDIYIILYDFLMQFSAQWIQNPTRLKGNKC